MSKSNLKNVTLVAVSGIESRGALHALEQSMKNIEYAEVVFISHNKPENLNPKIHFKQCKPTELVSKDPKSTKDYSHFMLYSLKDYISSDFVLIVHKNAYVIHPEKWDLEFLKYDYIGAPWPPKYLYSQKGNEVRVGNGGFSLRSKKLLEAPTALGLSFETKKNHTIGYNEDVILCATYRDELEQAGFVWAPVKTAAAFSKESWCAESKFRPFGFHDYKPTIAGLIPYSIKKLSNVMGEKSYNKLEIVLQKIRRFFNLNL